MKTLREYIDLVNTLSLLEWAPTPEQTKWLGGANQQDPYIMNRMPGAKPPVTWFTDPADQAKATQMGFPASEPAAAPAAAPAPEAPAAVATPVAEPAKIEPTPLPPVAAAPTPAKPPKGQGASPSTPGKPNPVMTLQNKLIGLGAKIKADGIMGPQTQAAMKQYGLDANGNPVKDAKTGQPVTNATTANAIIQRGGVDPKTITPDMTSAQQARSNIEAQRANAHLKNAAPGSLSARRNEIDAEYQAQNQAFLAKQAELKAAKAAASGQGPKPATPAAPVAGNVPPAPAGPPAARTKWAQQYGGKYDPATGAPLSESVGYNELGRIVSLVHYR